MRVRVFWDVLGVNSIQLCEATLSIHLQGLRSIKKNSETQRHVPEEMKPQQRRCEILKYHRIFFIQLKSYTNIPNERKCNLYYFHIRTLKQLPYTDVILPS